MGEGGRGGGGGGKVDKQGDLPERCVDALNNLPNSIAVLCQNGLTDGSDQLNNRSSIGLSEGLTDSS